MFFGSRKTFTLVEIMVVVGIVLILAALAMPNLLRSRINSNETIAVANLTTLYQGIQAYSTNNDYTYPAALTDLVAPTSIPSYVDGALTAGYKAGYEFEYARTGVGTFTLNANPRNPGATGIRYFYIDEKGTIRVNSTGLAGAADPALR